MGYRLTIYIALISVPFHLPKLKASLVSEFGDEAFAAQKVRVKEVLKQAQLLRRADMLVLNYGPLDYRFAFIACSLRLSQGSFMQSCV